MLKEAGQVFLPEARHIIDAVRQSKNAIAGKMLELIINHKLPGI